MYSGVYSVYSGVYRVTRVRAPMMKVGLVRMVVTVQWSMALVLALPPLLGFNRSVYCTVLYCTIHYSTVLFYTILY